MNPNKQDDMGRYRSTEQQITPTNVTFAINVNVLHLVVYCTQQFRRNVISTLSRIS